MKKLEEYDIDRFGPLLGVSDEGSAAQTIADAAHKSAKATALGDGADDMCVGVIIDGERMGSAGEVPIGPPEYNQVLSGSNGQTYCSTNVGVRVNTRIHQPLPEFAVSDAAANEAAWLDSVFNKFAPFIATPDGVVRPLTIRLTTKSEACLETLRDLVPKIEAGRAEGKLASPDLHRLSFLIEFEDEIGSDDLPAIRGQMQLAADLGVQEVAIDGKLVWDARRRISIQGLLNVLDQPTARALLGEAETLGIDLVYHFEIDQETAARTVWTGLNSAKQQGLTAAKYGLFPLKLDQQNYVVETIQGWMADEWTPIPAFYVDTPLVTKNDVYGSDRVVDAARVWMDMVSSHGAKVVLIDAPDRIDPHKLIQLGGENDIGVLSIEDDIKPLLAHAKSVGLKALWSGGIKPDQAYDLGKLGVAGIFTTGSASRPVPVHGTLEGDKALARQPEPTDVGVRRIHALVGAGFLAGVLDDQDLVGKIEEQTAVLRDRGASMDDVKAALDPLNETLVAAWKKHWGEG